MDIPAISTTSLTDLQRGDQATVLSIQADCLSRRLVALGFTPGASVQVAQNFGHGPLLVAVRGGFVALGRQEAGCIQVQRRFL